MDTWFARYAEWHENASFLDLGGRGCEIVNMIPTAFKKRMLTYSSLERDRGRAKRGALVCDLFDCAVGRCTKDIVFSRDVLEHLRDPMAAMKQWPRS